jgi:hypothetical protein
MADILETLGESAGRLAGMLRTGKFAGKDEAISLGFRIAIKRAMEDPRRGWVVKG